jgi:hypothetical protein
MTQEIAFPATQAVALAELLREHAAQISGCLEENT